MSANSVYALLAKKDKAHDDKIYGGAWAQPTVDNVKQDYIVTGGLDKVVKIWKLENNQLNLVHTLEGHKMGIVCVTVSADGHTVASISMDDTLIIWEVLSGMKIHDVVYGIGIANAFWTASFSPDGDYLAVAGYSGQIVVVQMSKIEEVQTINTRANVFGKFIISIEWSPDGKFLVAGAVDGVVRTYDINRDGILKHTIQAHKDPVRKVAFSANSKLIATASSDGMVKIYDTMTAALKGKLDHKCWAMGVCFSKDGTRIATGDDTGCVRVARARPLSAHGDDNESGRHGNITANSNGNVKNAGVANAQNGPENLELEVLNVFKEHLQAISYVQFSPDQNKLMSVSKDRSINIYEIPDIKIHNK